MNAYPFGRREGIQNPDVSLVFKRNLAETAVNGVMQPIDPKDIAVPDVRRFGPSREWIERKLCGHRRNSHNGTGSLGTAAFLNHAYHSLPERPNDEAMVDA